MEDEWVNIYDLLSIDQLAPRHEDKQAWWHRDYNEYHSMQMADSKAELKQLLKEMRVSQ